MEQKFYQSKVFVISLIIVLVCFVVLIAFGALKAINEFKRGKYIGQEFQRVNSVTVSATSEIYAKPDIGFVTLSVVTEAKTIAEAMTENTSKMNNVIGFVKEQGVEAKDLKTTNFSINPRYEYNRETGKRTLAGYEVDQSLQVKIRDLSKTGSILEGAAEFGANEVGNLQFTIDNEDALKAQAREGAIKKAKAKAEVLANQLGVNLIRITNFSEREITPQPISYYKTMMMEGVGGAEVPEIETGENKISVTVSITYEIN